MIFLQPSQIPHTDPGPRITCHSAHPAFRLTYSGGDIVDPISLSIITLTRGWSPRAIPYQTSITYDAAIIADKESFRTEGIRYIVTRTSSEVLIALAQRNRNDCPKRLQAYRGIPEGQLL